MLEDLTDAQYPGIDSRSKVKHLVDGIKTYALDTVKATIWASTTLRTYFEGTVDLFKKFIARQKTGSYGTNNSRAEYSTQHGGCGCGGGGGRGCGRFGGRGHGGGHGYQGREHGGSGRSNPPRRINGIDISDRYCTPN